LHAVFEATEARKESERFRQMAWRDALTGLFKRRYVDENLPNTSPSAGVHTRPVAGPAQLAADLRPPRRHP
jgi:two-component system, cell cycle response regulator